MVRFDRGSGRLWRILKKVRDFWIFFLRTPSRDSKKSSMLPSTRRQWSPVIELENLSKNSNFVEPSIFLSLAPAISFFLWNLLQLNDPLKTQCAENSSLSEHFWCHKTRYWLAFQEHSKFLLLFFSPRTFYLPLLSSSAKSGYSNSSSFFLIVSRKCFTLSFDSPLLPFLNLCF